MVRRSMSDLAGLTKPSGAIPRGSYLYICAGLTTVLSGYFSGPPILVSPESAAGIKAGAKTGLSTVVCGIFFGFSVFFWPVFKAVPAAGTAPLLIIVGTNT
jgi:AGZA family xanthine/uracil permease-like MFS transporter